MQLRLYNTMTRSVDEFVPINSKNVGMYVCGPTVYDYAHIGNARPVIVFDVLFRMLRHIYGVKHVKYVRNITDVDDKIIAAHIQSGESIHSITRRTTRAYREDVKELGAIQPTREPRATKHIRDMIALVETLLAKGNAYFADGHVLFNVPSMSTYGRLSRRDRDEQIAGSRVEVAPYKKDPADFVLWKPSSNDEPGWTSPWGRGRPGWHLECSAMSEKHLGPSFDIHGGGIDLSFPHHENEIAQSTCAHGEETFARVWVHNGFLMVEGQKMSKSLGNFITIRDALKRHHGETIRLAMLKTHYQQPIDWTESSLVQARETLDSWYNALKRATNVIGPKHNRRSDFSVDEALCDDLNTPRAISALSVLASNLNLNIEYGRESEVRRCRYNLLRSAKLLGLLRLDPHRWFQDSRRIRIVEIVSNVNVVVSASSVVTVQTLSDEAILNQIHMREEARKAKNYAAGDRIRAELAEAGVILEDGPSGTTWRRG